MLNEDGAAADDSDRQRCPCLPAFCFWGASGSGGRPNNKPGAAQAKRRRRRRPRLSWLAWPWFRRSGKGDGADDDGSEKGKRRRRGGRRRLLLLLTTSLQPKKALASVVSGDSSALLPVPVPAKVRLIQSIDRVMGVRDRCSVVTTTSHHCLLHRYRLCAY